MSIERRLFVFVSMIFSIVFVVCAQDNPFWVKSDMFDQSNASTLGLDKATATQTITVFAPTSTSDQYSNGVVLTSFKGKLYCQWQSSATDEDAADTWVAYSRSEDGVSWSAKAELQATIDDGYCSSGGWWSTADTLVAYINVWPVSVSPRGGYTYYKVSTDGEKWSDMKPLMMANGDTLKGIFEQDPHALPGGRIINAAHFQPGLTANPIYTDDSTGIRGWIRADFTNLTPGSDVSREIEPSWFYNSVGQVIMTFRDQTGSNKRLASVSDDNGEHWTEAVLTQMPDSRSKQSAGNLPDGSSYLVGNPVTNTTRIPLVVTLSASGNYFNTSYLLRGGDDIQTQRFQGLYKRTGYHYPKSYVWKDHLYVSYATNKEDVEVTSVPLSNLAINDASLDAPIVNVTNVIIDEHTEKDTEIGLVETFNPAGGTLSYSIISGNTNEAFSIDESGKILVNNQQAVDYETSKIFWLDVSVSNGAAETIVKVKITLRNIDEPALGINILAFKTYPNPFTNQFKIEVDQFDFVEVYDISGQLLLQQIKPLIDLSGYINGVYLVKIYTQTGMVSGRVIKQ